MSASTPAVATSAIEQLLALLMAFRLPTVAAEVVARFTKAGHAEALATLLGVLELEADDRKERRVERLRGASKLPPG